MDWLSLFDELEKIVGPGRVRRDAPMREYTSFRLGGAAALLAEPGGEQELAAVLQAADRAGAPCFVMGNGTNLLVRDTGYPGVVVYIGPRMADIFVEGVRLVVKAGALLSAAAARAQEAGLTGMEFASGIPGSIGGALFMNAGAYDGEMSKIVEEVRVLARDGSRIYTLKGPEMEYGYRHSVLMERGDIALAGTLKLRIGDPKKIRAQMKELMEQRNSKQPVDLPSAGSFFKRPPGNFAGKLIEDAGLKGLSLGGAQVSPLHAGFIVNRGGATATDVIDLMEIVRSTVYDRFGVKLEPEVRILG